MSCAQENPCKFIADTMLGKLARWLSLLGYDIIYSGVIDDDELVREAKNSQRIILTRDTKLIEMYPETPALLIKSTNLWEQLREVIKVYKLDFSETAFSRCSNCNVEIEPVDKEEVAEQLPPLVRQTQEKIWEETNGQSDYNGWRDISTDGNGTRSTQKPAVLTIGPAGENLCRVASLIHDAGNGSGQGGFGAVWGSKNLKAISVMGTGTISVADPNALFAARLWAIENFTFPLNEYDKEKVAKLFKKLGFHSLMKYLPQDKFEVSVQAALF